MQRASLDLLEDSKPFHRNVEGLGRQEDLGPVNVDSLGFEGSDGVEPRFELPFSVREMERLHF